MLVSAESAVGVAEVVVGDCYGGSRLVTAEVVVVMVVLVFSAAVVVAAVVATSHHAAAGAAAASAANAALVLYNTPVFIVLSRSTSKAVQA